MMSTATASAAGGVGRSNSKFPFTATQWQELEHQALIYKYMAAGIPIPPDLLFTIKRSLDSSLSSKLFPYQPSPLGWNPYQMGGYGKKIDPEPGRCRRTDGKKWRCSKEAYPDSKYCERHMHRGKNRSRKPVENPAVFTTNSPAPSAATTTATSINNHNHNNNNNNGASASPTNHSSSNSATLTHQSLLKNHPSSLYSLPSDSSYTNNTNLYSHSSYSRERYIPGLKEEVGEHSFFADNSSGSSMRGYSASSIDESWPLSSKQSGGGYPNYLQQLQNSNNNSNHHTKHQQQEKQCYVWGRDFNCDLSMKVEDERENTDKTIHHFFDEWPLKTGGNGGGGGGNGGRDSSWHDSSSTTHLSISIPSSTSHHDFFLSNSRNHHDG